MGCGASRKNIIVDINSDYCGVEEIDSLLAEVQSVSQEIKRTHKSLKLEINRFQERTFTRLLDNALLGNSIYVMMITLSAATKGQFERINLKITPHPPYISFSTVTLSNTTTSLVSAWEILVEVTVALPEQLQLFQEQVMALLDRSNAHMAFANKSTPGNSLRKWQTVKMLKTLNGNVQKLNSSSQKIEMIKEKLCNTTRLFSSLASIYNEKGLNTVSLIGKKAFKDGCFDPQQLIVMYLMHSNNEYLKTYINTPRTLGE